MKFTVVKPVEIDVAFIELILPIRYGTKDIPEDFPLRKGDIWQATIDIGVGKIEGWPTSETDVRKMHMKVCDEGVYILRDISRKEIARREDYVPEIITGSYGDYVELDIEPDGKIADWRPRKSGIAQFFPNRD